MDLPLNNGVRVTMAAHPFAVERIAEAFPEGKTVADIMAILQPDAFLRRHAHVYLDGHYVPRENWARLRPKAGTLLSVRVVPMGGGGQGGKNPLRTILTLAIIAASPAIGASLTTALGSLGTASFMGMSVGRIVTAGVSLLGRLALNALAPPGRGRFAGNQKESPTLFLQGARNQAVPFSRIPRVLGKHRMVPPMGALPYTETVGGDQYLRLLFVWGYGPLHISDLKIGETPLSDFEGVEIETREGYDDDDPITLYSNVVVQNDLSVSLTQAGGYTTRTTEIDADEISVDITLPRGLVEFAANGAKTETDVQIEVQYSPTGMNQWSVGATSYDAVSAQQVTCTRPSAYVFKNIPYAVTRIYRVVMDPATGAVQLIWGPDFRNGLDIGSAVAPSVPAGKIAIAQIERKSDDAAVIPVGKITDERPAAYFGEQFEDAGNFAATPNVSADLVDIAAGGLRFDGLILTGSRSSAIRKNVTFKVPQGQYDVRLRRITADAVDDNTFDETVWTALRTIRYVNPVNMDGVAVTALRIKATDQLSGILDRFNGVVHSILPDWTGTDWVEQVTSNPASLYRHVLQGTANARPLLDSRVDITRLQDWHDVCGDAEREFNAVIDYDVSVREVLSDIAAAGRASPALVDSKWSVVEDMAQSVPVQHFTPRNTYGFRGGKAFDDIPHALRVRFINRDKGWMQDERLVFDDGYDAETAIKYETLELPGITSSDQAWRDGRYHIATARLRPETYSFHVDVEHIVCTRGDLVRFTHDVPLFGLAAARVKALQTSGGNTTGVTLDADVTMEAGKSYAVRFRKTDGSSVVAALTTAAGTGDTVVFDTPVVTASGPAVGDLAMFGESGTESVELVVKSIMPQGDLGAKITCVDAAPAVHTADTGSIPAHSSQITVPPEMQRPPVPVIVNIQSADEVVVRGADRTFAPVIVISLAPTDYALPLDADVRIKTVDETEYYPASFTYGGNLLTLSGLVAGTYYDVRIFYKNRHGAASAPLSLTNYKVDGVTGVPGDVNNFIISMVGATAQLSWDMPGDINLDHYIVKFANKTSGAGWASSFEIGNRVSRTATHLNVPAQIGTWLIKSVDTEGRECDNAAAVVSTIDKIDGYTVTVTVDEDGNFSGGMTAGSTDVLYTAGGRLELDGALSGTYYFEDAVDLGDIYVSLLSANMDALGVSEDNLVDDWSNVDLVEDWEGALDPSVWGAQLQVRSTSDDPAGSPVWTAWKNFTVGEYSARAFEFRLLLSAAVEGTTPSVETMEISVAMLNWAQGLDDVTSSSADDPSTGVVYGREFYSYTAVTVTPHDMETGDYYEVSSKDETGFSIRFYNASDTRITRTFDYIAQGTGRKVIT